jgi:hypothetical protein
MDLYNKDINYPYDLNSIASHTKDLAIQLSKLLGITEYDAYEFIVDKLRDKNCFEVKL